MRYFIWILAMVYMCQVLSSRKMNNDDPFLHNITDEVTIPDNTHSCHHKYSYKQKLTGIFHSPDFPQKYPGDKECTYFFHASDDGRIMISFDFFDMEAKSDKGCQFDYIEIHNVDSNGFKKRVNRYCGKEVPDVYISMQPKLELLFKSDATKNLHGFMAHYEFLGDNWQPFGPSTIGCGAGYLKGIGGVITSPNYPGFYPSKSRCTWIIKVESYQRILIRITDMEISSSRVCSDLCFFNGFAIPGMSPEESYCGSLENYNPRKQEILSTSSRVVIRFDSANTARKTGFKLTWTAVSLVKSGECHGFLCDGSDHCRNSRYVCKDSATKYCIDQSLQCNSLPNCGAVDSSDEDKCLSKVLWIVLYTVVPIVVIVIIVIWVVFCYKRHKRQKLYIEKKEAQRSQQTHWVSPHIRSLEHSPNPGRANTMLTTSFISSKHSSDLDYIGKNRLDLEYNDKNTLDLDYQDSPVKENRLNEKTKAENLINTFADESPKKVNSQSTAIDSNKVENENKLTVPCLKNKLKEEEAHVQFELDTIPNFRTHQKRSSYHLMQELNLGESEVMIAKI